MAYSLSDNAKEVLLQLIAAAVIVVPILWQSHNQHVEQREANAKTDERLDTIAKEVKATQRPLVFGEGK